MNHIDNNKKLRASILDRLIDEDPSSISENDTTIHQKISQLRKSVMRDLENLLNTRFRQMAPPDELVETKSSIMNYGLPDLATVNITDHEKRILFTKSLEKTLIEFEPRFKKVRVKYLENVDTRDRTLRFRIDATLYADPHPEIVIFDSILDPVSRSMNIEETTNA